MGHRYRIGGQQTDGIKCAGRGLIEGTGRHPGGKMTPGVVWFGGGCIGGGGRG